MSTLFGSGRRASEWARSKLPGATGDDDRSDIVVSEPFTGDRMGSVPAATPEDVSEAAARAREAQVAWANRSREERAEVLLDVHDRILDERDDLLDLVQREAGKARMDAFEEVSDVAINARHYATRADEYLAPRRRKGAFPLATKAVEYRHPVGLVGIISPWNYPLTLAVSDALPALLAGNSVVLKPAEQTPFTALAVAEILHDAGVPEDVFQVLPGRGSEAGPALIDESDFVCFTGSSAVGRNVAEQAGGNLTKVSLELGGKNPMIVLDDADVERAVEGAVRGSFTNAGQLCIAFERIYVHEDVYEAFRDAFVARVRSLELGTGLDYTADVGSLIGADQLAKVEEHVDDAVERGASLLTGGRHRPDVGPYFFEPTVLEGVDDTMLPGRAETFGPVVSLYPVAEEEEAVRRANDSEYGLNAAIYTGDEARGERLAPRIRCGTVNVNDPYIAAWASVDAPMGGMGDSGVGRRHGREGIHKYTESQTVATQRFLPTTAPEGVDERLYVRATTGALRLLKKVPGVR